MSEAPVNAEELIAAWRTSHNATTFLIKNLPDDLWPEKVPGYPRRTIRGICAHFHNSRCSWIKMIGATHGIAVPRKVSGTKVEKAELLEALKESSEGIIEIIRLGASQGRTIPPAAWQNFPTDLVHFLSYFVAHEAHHRGQIVLTARAIGKPLKISVIGGIWHWKKRARD
jgi:uncharacterized damage-inducible protein DinB